MSENHVVRGWSDVRGPAPGYRKPPGTAATGNNPPACSVESEEGLAEAIMNNRSSHAPRSGSSLGGLPPIWRVGAACGVALALAAVTLVAQQPTRAPVVTDKQRKSLTGLAEPWPDEATIAKRKADAETLPIFASSKPFAFTLAADFKAVQRDRNPASTTLYPATLTAAGPDGQLVRLDVQIRNRGLLRRNARTCGFPPLRIEFTKDDNGDLKRSIFKGLKHIKLSTHCESAFDQFVVREYLAYRYIQPRHAVVAAYTARHGDVRRRGKREDDRHEASVLHRERRGPGEADGRPNSCPAANLVERPRYRQLDGCRSIQLPGGQHRLLDLHSP